MLSRRQMMVGTALAGQWVIYPAMASFPERTVHLVVPFAPGGGTDIIARTLGTGLGTELGQTVIIDNKGGAGTIIGSEYVAKSAPDGHTLLVATFAHAVNPSLHAKLPYDTNNAFAPVILLGRSYNVLVVRTASPFMSVADVLIAARAAPGKLTYASQGIGTSAHLAGEMFKNLAQVEMTHVPYKGAGPALNDVLSGQVDMMFATSAAVPGFVASKTMRALGTTAAAGGVDANGVKAIADLGVPGYAVESWYGLYAPAGTPADIIAKIGEASRKAMQTPDFKQRAASEGLTIDGGGPDALEKYVSAEAIRWNKIVVENKIKAE